MWGPSLVQGVWAYRHLPRCQEREDRSGMAKDPSAEPHTPQMSMWGDTVKRSSETEQSLFLGMGASKGMRGSGTG